MQESTSPAANFNRPDQSESSLTSDLAQRLTARAGWVQRAISPWMRRWLPSESAEGNGETQERAALTVAQTTSFLGHIQRVVETASLWRLDTDTIQPLRYDRFGQAIVARFPDTSQRFQVQPATANPTDLVLAGTGEVEVELQATPQQPGDFKPFGSLADFQAALAAKERGESFEAEPQATPQQPSGFKPFASFAAFQAALAAKERGESFETEPQATPQPSGPYNKPFASLADFEAALAAKEREARTGPPAHPPASGESTLPTATETKPLSQSHSMPPPQIQRLRQPGYPARTWPPGTRPRAKIEEVTPAVETGPKMGAMGGKLPANNSLEEEFGAVPSGEDRLESDLESNQGVEFSPVQRQLASEIPQQPFSRPMEPAVSTQGSAQTEHPPATQRVAEPPPSPAVKTSSTVPGQPPSVFAESEQSLRTEGQNETATPLSGWLEEESSVQSLPDFETRPAEELSPSLEDKHGKPESSVLTGPEIETKPESPIQHSVEQVKSQLPADLSLAMEDSTEQLGKLPAAGNDIAKSVVPSTEPKLPAAGQSVVVDTMSGQKAAERQVIEPLASASTSLQRQAEPEPQTASPDRIASKLEVPPEQKSIGAPAIRPTETTSQTEPDIHTPVGLSGIEVSPEVTSAQRLMDAELQLPAPGQTGAPELLPVPVDKVGLPGPREFTPQHKELLAGSESQQRDTSPQPKASVQRSAERQVGSTADSQQLSELPGKQEPLSPELGQTKQVTMSPVTAPESHPLTSVSGLDLEVLSTGSVPPRVVSSLPRDIQELNLQNIPTIVSEPLALPESIEVSPEESQARPGTSVQRSPELTLPSFESEESALPARDVGPISPRLPALVSDQLSTEIATPQAALSQSAPEELPSQDYVSEVVAVSSEVKPEQGVPLVQRATEVEMPLRELPLSESTPKPGAASETAPPSSVTVANELSPRLSDELLSQGERSEERPVSLLSQPEQEISPVQRATEVEMSVPGPTPKSAGSSETIIPSSATAVNELPSMVADIPLRQGELSEHASSVSPNEPEQGMHGVQRATELELPFREPSTPKPAAASETEVPSNVGLSEVSPVVAEPLSKQDEVSERTSGASPAKPEQGIRSVQRTTDLEMPLREPLFPLPQTPTPSEMVASEVAAGESPTVMSEESPQQNENLVGLPISPPVRQEQSVSPVQRTTDLEMPLREPSIPGSTQKPAVTSEKMPLSPEVVANETPLPTESASRQGVMPEGLPVSPPVQRTTDLEMPLRESPLSRSMPQPAGSSEKMLSSPEAVESETPSPTEISSTQGVMPEGLPISPSGQRTTDLETPLRESPLSRSMPQPAGSSETMLSSPEAVESETPSLTELASTQGVMPEGLPVSPPVQRTTGLEMPLREPSPSGSIPKPAVASETVILPPETVENATPSLSEPSSRHGAVSEELTSSPLVRSKQGIPPVQRTTELAMPLRETQQAESKPQGHESSQNLENVDYPPVPLGDNPEPTTRSAVPTEWTPRPSARLQPELIPLSGESSDQSANQMRFEESPFSAEAVSPKTETNVQQLAVGPLEMPLRPQPVLQRQPDDISPGNESPAEGGLDEDIVRRTTSSADWSFSETETTQNRLGRTQAQPPMPTLPQARRWTIQTAAKPETGEALELAPPLISHLASHSMEQVAMPLAAPLRIETKRENIAAPLDMPLPSPPPSPTPVIQRQPVEPEPASARTETGIAPAARDVIQRAEDGNTSNAQESETMAGAELDKLAREIFPLIKRMLAVERERRPIR